LYPGVTCVIHYEEEGENQHKRENDPDGIKDMDVDGSDKDDYCKEPSDGGHLQTASDQVRAKLRKWKTPDVSVRPNQTLQM
jgi:hypothetical protein